MQTSLFQIWLTTKKQLLTDMSQCLLQGKTQPTQKNLKPQKNSYGKTQLFQVGVTGVAKQWHILCLSLNNSGKNMEENRCAQVGTATVCGGWRLSGMGPAVTHCLASTMDLERHQIQMPSPGSTPVKVWLPVPARKRTLLAKTLGTDFWNETQQQENTSFVRECPERDGAKGKL